MSMRRGILWVALIGGAALCCGAVESDSPMQLVGVFPLPGDLFTTDAVFYFDEALAPLPSSAGAPFTSEPPLTGQFRIEDNYIAFRSKEAGGGVYRITLNEALRSVSGRPLEERQRRHVLSGYEFKPDRAWCISQNENESVVGIHFTGSVNAEVLQGAITVRTTNGAWIVHRLEQGTNAHTLRAVLPPEAPWPVEITLAKGVRDTSGLLSTRAVERFTVGGPAPLTISSVRWVTFQRDVQEAEITFSESVDGEALAASLTVAKPDSDEAIPFERTSSGLRKKHTFRVHLSAAEAARLTVAITEGLRDSCGGRLKTAYKGTLHHQSKPQVINYMDWYNRSPEGVVLMLNLAYAVPLQEFEKHLQFEPAVQNIQVASPYGRRYEITGEWDSKQDYTLRLTAGMKDLDGEPLGQAIERQVHSPEVPSYLDSPHRTSSTTPNATPESFSSRAATCPKRRSPPTASSRTTSPRC